MQSMVSILTSTGVDLAEIKLIQELLCLFSDAILGVIKLKRLIPQLEKTLINLKAKMSKSEGLNKSDPNADRKKFQDKLLHIMLLRSCKSIDDLYRKEVNMLAKNEDNGMFLVNVSNEGSKAPQCQFPAEGISQIQKIKQKLISKATEYLKIDKQRQKQQQSRKVIDKNFSKDKQTKALTKAKLQQQCQTDDLGVSYNYFKYGQKLSLIEGRTIQFKHFKDISDPNHIPLIMRYITAFLNTQGGKLYIGIDDNSYAYGAKFKQSEYDKLLLKIDNQGKFYMTPPLMPQKYNIKLIPVYHDRKGEQRWVIEIMVFPPKEQNKKLFLYNRECYMRMNASTHKLNAIDIIELMSLNSENSAQVKQEDCVMQNQQKKTGNFFSSYFLLKGPGKLIFIVAKLLMSIAKKQLQILFKLHFYSAVILLCYFQFMAKKQHFDKKFNIKIAKQNILQTVFLYKTQKYNHQFFHGQQYLSNQCQSPTPTATKRISAPDSTARPTAQTAYHCIYRGDRDVTFSSIQCRQCCKAVYQFYSSKNHAVWNLS